VTENIRDIVGTELRHLSADLAALCVRYRLTIGLLDDAGQAGSLGTAIDAQIGPLIELATAVRLGRVRVIGEASRWAAGPLAGANEQLSGPFPEPVRTDPVRWDVMNRSIGNGNGQPVIGAVMATDEASAIAAAKARWKNLDADGFTVRRSEPLPCGDCGADLLDPETHRKKTDAKKPKRAKPGECVPPELSHPPAAETPAETGPAVQDGGPAGAGEPDREEPPFSGTYWPEDLGLGDIELIGELNSCDVFASSGKKVPKLRGIVDVRGWPYAAVGGVHQGGKTLRVRLHGLMPRDEWNGDVLTYGELGERRHRNGDETIDYRGLLVEYRGKQYVLVGDLSELTVSVEPSTRARPRGPRPGTVPEPPAKPTPEPDRKTAPKPIRVSAYDRDMSAAVAEAEELRSGKPAPVPAPARPAEMPRLPGHPLMRLGTITPAALKILARNRIETVPELERFLGDEDGHLDSIPGLSAKQAAQIEEAHSDWLDGQAALRAELQKGNAIKEAQADRLPADPGPAVNPWALGITKLCEYGLPAPLMLRLTSRFREIGHIEFYWRTFRNFTSVVAQKRNLTETEAEELVSAMAEFRGETEDGESLYEEWVLSIDPAPTKPEPRNGPGSKRFDVYLVDYTKPASTQNLLGVVMARGKDDARAKARAQWPDELRGRHDLEISVIPVKPPKPAAAAKAARP
jgi:hypothetical protein